MKLLLTALSIALASSTLATAAPAAAPPSTQAAAPSADRLALARQFVALTSPPETMISEIREASLQMAMMSADDDDEATRAKADKYIARLFQRGEPALRKGMPGVLEAYAQAYAREFSSEELAQLTAFAQTAGGKHYLKRVDFLDMDDGVVAAQGAMMDEFQDITFEVTREMCAEKAEQRIAAGDVKAKCPLSQPDVASG